MSDDEVKMRKEHDFEKKFKDWKKAGYGDIELNPIQEQEIKRAFMGGVFEGLNFVIGLLESNSLESDIGEAYKFLRAFHENEIKVNKKSPFGKQYF